MSDTEKLHVFMRRLYALLALSVGCFILTLDFGGGVGCGVWCVMLSVLIILEGH